MAAHLKTGVEQVLESIKSKTIDKDIISGAVNLSCWTEDNWDIWLALKNWTEDKISTVELKTALENALPGVSEKWEKLGRPNTREEWWDAEIALRS